MADCGILAAHKADLVSGQRKGDFFHVEKMLRTQVSKARYDARLLPLSALKIVPASRLRPDQSLPATKADCSLHSRRSAHLQRRISSRLRRKSASSRLDAISPAPPLMRKTWFSSAILLSIRSRTVTATSRAPFTRRFGWCRQVWRNGRNQPASGVHLADASYGPV